MIIKKSEQLYLHCLPIPMLLYVMLAYLMLFSALLNAVCLHNACLSSFFLPFTFTLLFIQMLFALYFVCWALTHNLFISIIFCVIHCAFNELVGVILFSRCLCLWKSCVLSEEIALKNNHYCFCVFLQILFPHLPWAIDRLLTTITYLVTCLG